MQTTYANHDAAPGGVEAVIRVMNHCDTVGYEVGEGNAYLNYFAANKVNFKRVTPTPNSLTWHRNTRDAKNTVVAIETAELVLDHYGRNVPLVTGWSMALDGRPRAFAATPMTPLNPGGSTNYAQRDTIAEQFVAAAKDTIGKIAYVDQLGWGASLPVQITGRGRSTFLQVTGLTVAEIRDAEGTVLFSGMDTAFEADPKDSTKPAPRNPEKSRTRGTAFWPVLSDQKLGMMEAAANGEPPAGDGLGDDSDMVAFLASVTSST